MKRERAFVRKKLFFLATIIWGMTIAFSASAQSAVSTFHSTGIYWSPSNGSASNSANVEYRPLGTSSWKDALPLWFDVRNGEYRGSIVDLTPDTTYEIRLTLDTGATETFTTNTWSEDFPISQTIHLPQNSSNTLNITESGSASGYILYTSAPGQNATIDVAGNNDNNISVSAHHVIIRGLTLKGAGESAIQVNTNSHDVVIEENDISGWGRVNSLGWGTNPDAAVRSNTAVNISRLTIQRNSIHSPRGDTNSWDEPRSDVTPSGTGYHPTGPTGIYLTNTDGNHVIRYNDIYSDDEHYFNDGISGASNGGTVGNLNRDSDVYGNSITQAWDDAIEVEGGNNNIRIWGNYLDHTYIKIGLRDVNVGPTYVWRNIGRQSRFTPNGTSDDDRRGRGTMFKTGSDNGGGVFIFHNTVLQDHVPGSTFPLGSGRSISGSLTKDTTSRNNIFETAFPGSRESINTTSNSSANNNFDYDLYNGAINAHSGAESNGIFGVPTYDSGNDFIGEFYLASNSLGVDDGEIIPNFNDGYTGSAPDMGAAERGSPPMEFGVGAYLNSPPDTQAPSTPTGLTASAVSTQPDQSQQRTTTALNPCSSPCAHHPPPSSCKPCSSGSSSGP